MILNIVILGFSEKDFSAGDKNHNCPVLITLLSDIYFGFIRKFCCVYIEYAEEFCERAL